MQTKVSDFLVSYPNRDEFLSIKKEVFVDKIYSSRITNVRNVVDIGAHIGLATLYFSKQFPDAIINSYEPHPATFAYLLENVNQNGLINCHVYNLAATASGEPVEFFSSIGGDQWFSNSSLYVKSWNGVESTESITVDSVSLYEILEALPIIDILKIDIEGYELALLNSADSLDGVRSMFIEYHPVNKNRFKKIQKLLSENGYKIEFRQNGQTPKTPDSSDLMIIYAYRI